MLIKHKNEVLRKLQLLVFSSFKIKQQELLVIVWSPPSPFLKGVSKFNYLPRRGVSEILQKGSGSMVQGQVFLKVGEGLALLLFNFFKVYHFYIYKLLYYLQNCVMHLKKNYFFCHHNFTKKVILSCLKINLKISHKLR